MSCDPAFEHSQRSIALPTLLRVKLAREITGLRRVVSWLGGRGKCYEEKHAATPGWPMTRSFTHLLLILRTGQAPTGPN